MRKAVYYAAVAVLAVVVMLAILAPWVAPYDPNAQDLLGRLQPNTGSAPTNMAAISSAG